ncbi:hypothetical protein [Vibrio mediterranei]|uniref:hypothetical protein n=1 Tax=Vibrio mediterranei TaxID=689 RepID=UPI004068FF0C
MVPTALPFYGRQKFKNKNKEMNRKNIRNIEERKLKQELQNSVLENRKLTLEIAELEKKSRKDRNDFMFKLLDIAIKFGVFIPGFITLVLSLKG